MSDLARQALTRTTISKHGRITGILRTRINITSSEFIIKSQKTHVM
ncbi:hypothetical protein HMPREF9080_00646 [Cardiobacterium valvarum F0432]|uniref:Uncharacterized protein n=1 Tax=Cardiobacterium valvarum F0432 TaxID=797473 RepID=G9ZD13_9GAMM|nr:hypothetical protein HMPREF9080_00646 [Cardiobacterium valvarum F0432]